ncbi:MAG: ABC transporter ATP-binding protein [Azospirillaceae bacterium]
MTGQGVGTLVVDTVRRDFGAMRAVDDIALTVEGGEFVTLLGPSGCGKTTLLRMVAGLERPDAGRIVISGQEMTHAPPERRPVNYVFQHYALFPHLDLERNVGFGLEVRGLTRTERESRTRDAIAMVRLSGLESRRVDELSGGQQQRVALARAIVNRPDILLLDEPLGALDLKLRKEMQFELRQIHRRLGSTFIYVTHDQEEALTMSDRIIVMRDGRIEQDGTPEQVYHHPCSRFVAEFIGETNMLEGRASGGVVSLEAGGSLEAPGVADGPVAVSIRPEKLAIAAATETGGAAGDPAGGGAAVALEGVFVDSIFLGSLYRRVVELPGGRLVTVQQTAGGADAAHRPGERVRISWRAGDAVVLTR